jgi:ankyrin repeat protein
MVRCLIELGAPCSIPDIYGLTPLDMAREKGLIASTKLLEERGAKTRVDLIIEMSGE